MKLYALPKGEVAEIKSVDSSEISARLADIGFYEGQMVEVLFHSPFGDPIAVRVGQSTVSLRKIEAELIEVNR